MINIISQSKKNKKTVLRIRINRSEYLMLKQIMDKTKPNDLNDFNDEREAFHTFAIKLMRAKA
jgi:hypothetical protein